MASHPLGRRRLAAAAALAVLGLLLAVLGQASASQLHVEADGNLVWSRAWPDSPPDPPGLETPPMTGTAVCNFNAGEQGYLWYFDVEWTILKGADQSLPYNVYLVTQDFEQRVPDFGLVPTWWPHSHVHATAFTAIGWQASASPRNVYLVLRDGNGTSIDAVRVTVGADQWNQLVFLACTGIP